MGLVQGPDAFRIVTKMDAIMEMPANWGNRMVWEIRRKMVRTETNRVHGMALVPRGTAAVANARVEDILD
jgi:hypothetical protein